MFLGIYPCISFFKCSFRSNDGKKVQWVSCCLLVTRILFLFFPLMLFLFCTHGLEAPHCVSMCVCHFMFVCVFSFALSCLLFSSLVHVKVCLLLGFRILLHFCRLLVHLFFRCTGCVWVQLSLVMKVDANLAELYDAATELEQVFIKKLALFFTGELGNVSRTHSRRARQWGRGRGAGQ